MDNLAKVREWIQTRKLCTMDEHMKFYCKEAESDYNMLSRIEEVIDSLQEEPVNEELEKAAINHAVERFRVTRDRFLAEKCKWSFISGAQWKEKQMMKNSFGATVCKYGNTFLKEMDKDAISDALKGFTNGDMVRVIIIKQE